MKFMWLTRFGQLHIKFSHVVGGGIGIVGAKMTLDRAADVFESLERRREIAAPGAKAISRIKRYSRLKCRIDRGAE